MFDHSGELYFSDFINTRFISPYIYSLKEVLSIKLGTSLFY